MVSWNRVCRPKGGGLGLNQFDEISKALMCQNFYFLIMRKEEK